MTWPLQFCNKKAENIADAFMPPCGENYTAHLRIEYAITQSVKSIEVSQWDADIKLSSVEWIGLLRQNTVLISEIIQGWLFAQIRQSWFIIYLIRTMF